MWALSVHSQLCSKGAVARAPALLGREIGDAAGLTGELQDVHPGVGWIDEVDEPPVVDPDVVGLDGDLAALAHGGL
jgi:hypothetical protein